MSRRLIPFLLFVASFGLYADEGLWLYNQFPKAAVQQRYGFAVSDDLLNHLRLASVRLGASGSFVSPHGLIFTNHHVASRCIQKLSSPEHNYTANGFYAKTEADELRCPATEASVLLNIGDVTAEVNSGIKAKPGTPEANRERRASINKTESACSARTGHRCEVVTLYSGAQYHLYEYKNYTDVRLVFAPEKAIAFFGGDPDNFTYPRYDLDITFLRAYENSKPADTPKYLKWSRQGAVENELVFVSGNPASTDRFITLAEYDFMRDTSYPVSLAYLKSTISELKRYGAGNAENARQADDKVFSAENSYKARFWEQKGLNDAALRSEKQAREKKLKDAIAKNPKVRQEVGEAFDQIAAAYRTWGDQYKRYYVLDRGPFYSDLFTAARHVVRLPEEKKKPNAERLREYTEANLPATELRLYSPAPIYDGVEIAVLGNYLRFMVEQLGPNDAAVKAVLSGRTPEEAARHYVSTTKLKDVAERKRLAASSEAVHASEDGMIVLARLLDEPARAMRKKYEDELAAVDRAAGARIAQARFAVFGATDYPDATGTLRLSFGRVKGYKNAEGKPVPFFTDFAGMYQRATGEEPYKLPDSFLKAKDALNLSTPLNFVSTCDHIGGNSGSPAVNSKGEIIGILFDSNIEAMPNRFVYDETRGRAVQVSSQGIIEALKKVYGAQRVLGELGF